jgi:signal transduction histidine kinase
MPQHQQNDTPVAFWVGYAVLYCLLDRVSYIQPLGGTGITPWNPQWALAVAVLTRTPRLGWAAVITFLAAAVMPALRHASPVEQFASSVEVLGDVAIAIALRRWLGPLPALVTRRAFMVFVLVVASGAALQSALYAGILVAAGSASLGNVRDALFTGWVGAVNLIVALPLIFALGDRARRAELLSMMRTAEGWLIAACTVGVAYIVFVRSLGEQYKHFYLLFIPVGWAAARFGTAGAMSCATLVQLLLIAAVELLPYQPPTVFQLHMLLVALGAMGLLVGAIVNERQHAEQALRASLHAAAAADMAAALAHELNQPLTSLVTYARATQLLVERLEGASDAATAQIAHVTHKLHAEAMRAADVVRRLRDFFRQRGTQLENTDIGTLIAAVVRAHADRAERAGITLDWACEPALPPVMVDRVQMEVVLRNLVANALDAAVLQGGFAPFVRLRAQARGASVVVSVRDSGAGVDAAETHRLFEDRRSSKPGGMGIGLAISRSIVDAHDGRLWAEPGPGGKFHFSLPLSLAHDVND